MNFAEGDELTVPTPPVDPAAPAEPATPAVPAEPATPKTPATPEEPATPDPATPADPPVDPAAPVTPADPAKPAVDPKITALQNSLDAALGELAKNSEPIPTDPAVPAVPADPDAPAVPATPAPAPTDPATPDPATPATPVTGDKGWESAIEGIKKDQEEFKSNTVAELEQMKLKDEMIGLTAEVQAVLIKYPNVTADEVLFEIESGSEDTVAKIAEAKNKVHQKLIDKIAKEQGEKIKADLVKENEGKITVPQSAGTSPTPSGTPNPATPAFTKASHDSAWADATKAAKANLQ